MFYMPIGIVEILIIAVFILFMIFIVMVFGRTRRGRITGSDIVLIYYPDGISTTYEVEPLVPPRLYTYRSGENAFNLLIVRNPPIVYHDPRTGRARRLWIAVERDGVALTLQPEEMHTIGLASESIGDYDIDSVVKLVSQIIGKESYEETITLPNGLKISFTYKIYPSVAKLIIDLMRTRAAALQAVLASIRAAKEARELAEAVAIRGRVQLTKLMYTAIAVFIIMIAIAIILRAVGAF